MRVAGRGSVGAHTLGPDRDGIVKTPRLSNQVAIKERKSMRGHSPQARGVAIPSLYQQAWWPLFYNTLAVFVAVAFFFDAWTGNFAMSPAVHGQAVFLIPAEAWSGVLITAHGGFMFGLLLEGKRGAITCLLASFLALSVYSFFFVMASGAQFGGIVVYFSGLLFAPISLLFVVQSVEELWRLSYVGS